ncbi:hypothetical protein Ddye_022403 [Dipteronia dyeriana]|uniref:Uncharacterized protein n=1 Tax=Dipteronia dyeriana TaxID=168575 RepID=A0AAD9WYG8_9ROSI|nr:hypothetical protein Ddye_022403 [Dipteronia dyeriana]
MGPAGPLKSCEARNTVLAQLDFGLSEHGPMSKSLKFPSLAVHNSTLLTPGAPVAVGEPAPKPLPLSPSLLPDLASREASDLGYSSRVLDFTVGRVSYEYMRFLGTSDARWLDLDRIVKFNRHELVVYEDEKENDDIVMDDATPVQDPVDMNGGEEDEEIDDFNGIPLRQNHHLVCSWVGHFCRVGTKWHPCSQWYTSTAVGSSSSRSVISSVINVEKVANDKVVRDVNNKVTKELFNFSFDAPLNLHKELNHETEEVGSQLDVPGISASARFVLMHQVMVWELIKVLFSEWENSGQSKFVGADSEEDMMQDTKEGPPEVDLEALPRISKSRVQLLAARKCLPQGTRGRDVRLACLLSQAGGSMMSRSDVARQLNLWKINGLDFNFIEKDRIRLYELLAGNIHSSSDDVTNLQLTGRAIYVDEGPIDDAMSSSTEEHFDLSYHLMLLYASGARVTSLGRLCSPSHAPPDDYPSLQSTLIREILFQYCESLSSQESQRQFIEELGVPLEWLHEVMVELFRISSFGLSSWIGFDCFNMSGS